jgi:hypothetical protein
MTNVYVNGTKKTIQVPTGYDNLFNGVRFDSENQLAEALELAKKANTFFMSGILSKDTDMTLWAVDYQNKLIKILEDCRDAQMLDAELDCYDLRNDISTYEMEAA